MTISITFLILAVVGTEFVSIQIALHDPRLRNDLTDNDGVIIQQTGYACAPASLAMLLRDKGFDVSTYEIAKSLHTGALGTWLGTIEITGRKYGLKVTKERMNYNQIIDKNLPVIIIDHQRHSVLHAVYVLPDSDTGLLNLKDPLSGYFILDEKLFYEFFPDKHEVLCFVFE